MNSETKQALYDLAYEEEKNATEHGEERIQSFYSRSGRFIIERRRISYISTGSKDAPICMRVHPMNLSFPAHSHDFIEIMYVCSGKVVHRLGDDVVELGEGDIIILGRNATHSIDKTGNNDLAVNFIISAETYEHMLSAVRRSSSLDTSKLEGMLVSSDAGYLTFKNNVGATVGGLCEVAISTGLLNVGDPYLLESTVTLLFSFLCNQNGRKSDTYAKHDDKVRRLHEYIKSSYSTASLSEAAEILGLSRSYLSRWCSDEFGLGFKDLVMRERFIAACDLLENTDIPIGDVILNAGYENSSYFHKEFKRRFNITPKEYRKAKKER